MGSRNLSRVHVVENRSLSIIRRESFCKCWIEFIFIYGIWGVSQKIYQIINYKFNFTTVILNQRLSVFSSRDRAAHIWIFAQRQSPHLGFHRQYCCILFGNPGKITIFHIFLYFQVFQCFTLVWVQSGLADSRATSALSKYWLKFKENFHQANWGSMSGTSLGDFPHRSLLF